MIDRSLALVDPDVGIIRAIQEFPVHPGQPDLFVIVAQVQSPHSLPPRNSSKAFKSIRNTSGEPMFGSGAGVDRASALSAAVGEAVERFSLCIYDAVSVVHASYTEIRPKAVDPAQVILFDSSQYSRPNFPFQPYDPNAVRAWTKATDLSTAEDRYVPAGMVYFAFSEDKGKPLDAVYSTGAATGTSIEGAAMSAIFELIERDAFACMWLLQRTPPEIITECPVEQLGHKYGALLNHTNFRVRLFDITSDLGVPCALAIAASRNGAFLGVGASCRASMRDAARKALVEAYHSIDYLLDAKRANTPAPELQDIRDYNDHLRYYMVPERRVALDFILNGPGTSFVKLDELEHRANVKSLDDLVKHLSVRDVKTFMVDMTPDEICELGLFVARVVAPGLQPLSCGVGLEHLDRRRVDQYARNLGFKANEHLNLDPHPFP